MGESSSSYDPCYRLLGFSLEGVVKLSGLHFCRFAAQMRGGGCLLTAVHPSAT